MSKMGISTIASYRSGQLFEIVGLSSDSVVEPVLRRARRAASRAANFADLQGRPARCSPTRAWNNLKAVDHGGLLKFVHGGEYHMYNPDVIATLQASVISGEYDTLQAVYAKLVNERPASTLRDLLKLRSDQRKPIPVDEVESRSRP